MFKVFNYFKEIWYSQSLRKKLLFTLALLIIYRFLVVIPVPFVNIDILMERISTNAWGLATFFALFGWTLRKFSIIAVGLIPFINASIIMQLLTAVVPSLEELQEQWEVWYMQIQRYTRWLTVPLAFLQSIWMIFFINYIFWWNLINISVTNVLLAAFVMTVGTILLMWLWEIITEKGISNGISIIIFSSIVAGLTWKLWWFLLSAGTEILAIIILMLAIVISLIILSILLIRTIKEIPIIYARHWKIEETAVLPIPLNPVGMIPIIFAMAFVSFPYMISEFMLKLNISNSILRSIAEWISTNLNIYSQTPSLIAVWIYFVLIVLFTFFYTFIVFSPEKLAETIQKRWWYIPWIRPWEETAKYLTGVLLHLCFWWGLGLGFIGIYTYILGYIPFVQNAIVSIWTLPILVSGAGIIIIVGVVQEIINKINSEILMERYERI